jgi:non-ribosomal peptide synthetase component E (peptide arylation enzyme)
MTYFIQIDDEVREATEAEAKVIADAQAEAQQNQADLKTKAEAKAALLERLGITADEAALLLG